LTWSVIVDLFWSDCDCLLVLLAFVRYLISWWVSCLCWHGLWLQICSDLTVIVSWCFWCIFCLRVIPLPFGVLSYGLQNCVASLQCRLSGSFYIETGKRTQLCLLTWSFGWTKSRSTHNNYNVFGQSSSCSLYLNNNRSFLARYFDSFIWFVWCEMKFLFFFLDL